MSRPADARFLKSHEWARRDGDTVTMGVSDWAVDQLNKEIVYLELPDVGKEVKQGSPCGVIEAVKAASDIYAAVSGTVTEVNTAAVEDPAIVGEDAMGKGWMIKIRPNSPDELDKLMAADEYEQFIQSEAH